MDFSIRAMSNLLLTASGEMALVLLRCLGLASGRTQYDLLLDTGNPFSLNKCITLS
jgi:hypothetical protein